MMLCVCLIQHLRVFSIFLNTRDIHDLICCFHNRIPVYFNILSSSPHFCTISIQLKNFINLILTELTGFSLPTHNNRIPNNIFTCTLPKLRTFPLKSLFNQTILPHHLLRIPKIRALLHAIFHPRNPFAFLTTRNPRILL